MTYNLNYMEGSEFSDNSGASEIVNYFKFVDYVMDIAGDTFTEDTTKKFILY